jgi:hypothetical protein
LLPLLLQRLWMLLLPMLKVSVFSCVFFLAAFFFLAEA